MHALSYAVGFLLPALSIVNALPAGNAQVDKETNAKRLAQGLPPLPPKRLYKPKPAGTAPIAKRSTTGPVALPDGLAGSVGQFSCASLLGGLYPTCCDPDTTSGLYTPLAAGANGPEAEIEAYPTSCYINYGSPVDPSDTFVGDCTDYTATNPNPTGFNGYCCGTATFGGDVDVSSPLGSIVAPDMGQCVLVCSLDASCTEPST